MINIIDVDLIRGVPYDAVICRIGITHFIIIPIIPVRAIIPRIVQRIGYNISGIFITEKGVEPDGIIIGFRESNPVFVEIH